MYNFFNYFSILDREALGYCYNTVRKFKRRNKSKINKEVFVKPKKKKLNI